MVANSRQKHLGNWKWYTSINVKIYTQFHILKNKQSRNMTFRQIKCSRPNCFKFRKDQIRYCWIINLVFNFSQSYVWSKCNTIYEYIFEEKKPGARYFWWKVKSNKHRNVSKYTKHNFLKIYLDYWTTTKPITCYFFNPIASSDNIIYPILLMHH